MLKESGMIKLTSTATLNSKFGIGLKDYYEKLL